MNQEQQAETYKVRIFAKGGSFEEGYGIDEVIDVLQNFNIIYSNCLHKAAIRFSKDNKHYEFPSVSIDYVRKGSLSSLFSLYFPATIAIVQPLIGGYAWELLKSLFDLYSFISEHFKNNNSHPRITVDNSPNAQNIIINGSNNNVIICRDLYQLATDSQDNIANLANKTKTLNHLKFEIKKVDTSGKAVLDALRIDNLNSWKYIVKDKDIDYPEEIKIKVRIYRLDVKSKRGSLELLDHMGHARTCKFEIIDGEMKTYVDALSLDYIYVSAVKKMSSNPFSEPKLKYLFLTCAYKEANMHPLLNK